MQADLLPQDWKSNTEACYLAFAHSTEEFGPEPVFPDL